MIQSWICVHLIENIFWIHTIYDPGLQKGVYYIYACGKNVELNKYILKKLAWNSWLNQKLYWSFQEDEETISHAS